MKVIGLNSILIFMILLVGPASCLDLLPTQHVQWSGNGHYYEAVLVPGGITWDNANNEANNTGGHLATISSEDENQFVYDLFNGDSRYWYLDGAGNSEGPWLGAYQPSGSDEPAGGWTWVTGEPFIYTNWASREPDNNQGRESRLNFFNWGSSPSPMWNDIPDSFAAFGYIIEWDQSTPTITPSPIMTPSPEELEKWINLYDNAPDAAGTISTPSTQEQDLSSSDESGEFFSLLPYLQHNADERNQGNCGDCWQWAGTAVMEIQLGFRKNIVDRLSVEYINSNIESSGDDKPCCGGWLDYLTKYYTDRGQAVPWTNFNADWQDGKSTCGRSAVPSGSTSTSPAYSIASIQTEKIPTHGVGSATATNNIKEVLHQGKAVWFAFFLPNSDEWANFGNFWLNQQEDKVYQIDEACAMPYNYEGGGGHAVVIVGYDDTDPNNSYWIVLNSWGTANGLRPNGLFRISMDMDYDCRYTTDRYPYYLYAQFFETLDVTYAVQGNQFLGDLTGVWNSNDGGTYYIRQIGDILWWDGDSGSAGTWCNVAHGTIDGNTITLEYADVPEGVATGFGTLVLNIVSNDELETVSKPESYGGSRWWRESKSQPPEPPIIDTDPWNDPSVRSLIDEWLRQQDDCVKEIYPNAYIDSWGRICGETQSAVISCTMTPEKPADWDNYHYLWDKNWCPDYYPLTVQEYVFLRENGLSFDDLAECKAKGENCYS